MNKPWEQIENESDAAYVRFLVYRNLGPSRSLDTAYQTAATKSKEKQPLSGQWAKDSTTYSWVARARAWDIENLIEHGERVITTYVAALDKMMVKALEYLSDESNKPTDWESAVKSIELISKIVNGEAPSQLYSARATWARDDTEGRSA